MHELSIAMSMIDVASQEVARHGYARVAALHLKLGSLSGVDRNALEFSYQIACEGTPLSGSRLIIETVPVVVHCSRCMADKKIDSIQTLQCPDCGELSCGIAQGRELQVVALEFEEVEEFST
jgi:hydrogenase nickel incorporation protein HypA/HybF